MLEFGDPAIAGRRARQELLVQRAQSRTHSIFVEMHEWVAVGFLIAGVNQRIERQRIIFRRGDLFFDQRAEHPGFVVRKFEVHDTNIQDARMRREITFPAPHETARARWSCAHKPRSPSQTGTSQSSAAPRSTPPYAW